MKNLENYGVQVLDAREIRETDGGSLFRIVATCVSACIYLYNEGGDFGAGVQDYYNS